MVLIRQKLVCLMAERMMNTMASVLWRCLKYLWHMMHFSRYRIIWQSMGFLRSNGGVDNVNTHTWEGKCEAMRSVSEKTLVRSTWCIYGIVRQAGQASVSHSSIVLSANKNAHLSRDLSRANYIASWQLNEWPLSSAASVSPARAYVTRPISSSYVN